MNFWWRAAGRKTSVTCFPDVMSKNSRCLGIEPWELLPVDWCGGVACE